VQGGALPARAGGRAGGERRGRGGASPRVLWQAAAVAILLMLLLPMTALAQTRDLDKETREVAGALMCPVCQNLSAADSQSELAEQMRQVVRAKLAAGESREQILAYFVDRYGEEILIDPPKRGFNLFIWVVPPLLLIGFGVVLWRSVRRWRARGAEAPVVSPVESGAYAERLRRDLGSV
jgi:cytochrome c-type biogenesis protein CcmH